MVAMRTSQISIYTTISALVHTVLLCGGFAAFSALLMYLQCAVMYPQRFSL